MARANPCNIPELAEAFLHYAIGMDGSYAALLTTLTLLQPKMFEVLGVSIAHVQDTQGVLEAVRQKLQVKPAP